MILLIANSRPPLLYGGKTHALPEAAMVLSLRALGPQDCLLYAGVMCVVQPMALVPFTLSPGSPFCTSQLLL